MTKYYNNKKYQTIPKDTERYLKWTDVDRIHNKILEITKNY